MYYQKLLNRNVRMIFSIILVLCLATKAFAFTDPPYIPVQKPTPTATKTVCASGCDYSTLEAADQAAKPGWLIKVKAGTYTPTTWDSSGTSGNEIVIEAFGDGPAIFNCSGSTIFRVNADYVIFDGGTNRELVFDGTAVTIVDSVFRTDDNSSYLTVSRITVRRSAYNSCSSLLGGTNIGPYGDHSKYYNNLSYEACDEGFYVEASPNGGVGLEIRNNIVRDNDGTGIQVNPHGKGRSAHGLIIAGNAIYNNGFRNLSSAGVRPGISLLSNDNTLYDVYVYNNLIWNNKDAGIKVSPYSNIDARIYNNTVYNNVDQGVWFKTNPTYTVKNNIVYSNGGSNWIDPSSGITKSNNLTTNPGFVSISVSSTDYLKISSGSTSALDKGVDLSSEGITVDYLGSLRPKNSVYDIGAFEYDSGLPINQAPTAPQNLRLTQQ